MTSSACRVIAIPEARKCRWRGKSSKVRNGQIDGVSGETQGREIASVEKMGTEKCFRKSPTRSGKSLGPCQALRSEKACCSLNFSFSYLHLINVTHRWSDQIANGRPVLMLTSKLSSHICQPVLKCPVSGLTLDKCNLKITQDRLTFFSNCARRQCSRCYLEQADIDQLAVRLWGRIQVFDIDIELSQERINKHPFQASFTSSLEKSRTNSFILQAIMRP